MGLAAWVLGPNQSGWETLGRQRYRSYGIRGHGYVGTSAYGSRSWSFRFVNVGRGVDVSGGVLIKAPVGLDGLLSRALSSGPSITIGLVYRLLVLLALVGSLG